MATSKREIESFIKELKDFLIIGRIIYKFRDERGKNQDALLDLGIVPNQRDEYVRSLTVADYSEGPIEDVDGGEGLWVFGKQVNNEEVYIKLQLIRKYSNVLCISFHISDYPMVYPFKNDTDEN